MDYYFGEHLRWNLGWGTPNQAGAFIATLLPWLWALTACAWGRLRRSKGGWSRAGWAALAALAFAAEVVGTYALARTYSRGALVGLGIGALAWCGLVWLRFRNESKMEDGGCAASDGPAKNLRRFNVAAPWAMRGVLLVLCLGITGFHARMAPEHLAEDRSSLNRLVLWRGGAELITASPWRGWGWGQSGSSFMHWTQPLERSEGYLSMVNSYLTVAVEAGLPLFALISAGLLLPILRVANLFRRWAALTPTRWIGGGRAAGGTWLLGAASGWAAWLGCLIFSNLWIIRGLWIAPGIAAVALVSAWPHDRVDWRKTLLGASGLAALAALGMGLAGWVLAARQTICLQREADGRVTLTARIEPKAEGASTRSARVLVVPDADVLGESYGQELRRWLLADERLRELRVVGRVDGLQPSDVESAAAILLCGAATVEAGEPILAKRVGPVWLLHPTVAPPEASLTGGAGGQVLLPGIDVTGQTSGWWSWAAQAGPSLRVGLSSGLASDVRPRWPELGLSLGLGEAHGYR